MANLFSTSLFGYSKRSVNDYISKLNDEFSRKLLEKDQAHREAVEALQAETARLSRENEQLLALRQEVADALISAKDYAAELKRKAETDDQARRAANAIRQEAELSRIQDAAEQISALRQAFRDALERMDGEAASYKEELQRLRTAAERPPDAEQAPPWGEAETWTDEGGRA
jgi:hypothetical protein